MVKKSLNPKLLSSASDNVLWVWVLGIVYMIPGEKSGVNLSTLDCLEVEVQWRAEHSRILVMGDFNARVGELPNIVSDPDGEEEKLFSVPRTSVDTKVDSFGRRVMNSMNAIGLVLVNGIKERAEWTSFQRLGNAAVDLIWVPIESVSKVEKLKMWKEGNLVFGDHAMVSIILQLEHKVDDKKAFPQPVKTGDSSSRKRWNSLSSRTDSVQGAAESLLSPTAWLVSRASAE